LAQWLRSMQVHAARITSMLSNLVAPRILVHSATLADKVLELVKAIF
jgi:hypothetical protein